MLVQHCTPDQEGSDLPAAGYLEMLYCVSVLKFLFSASALRWEKELTLLSQFSFSFKIESCQRSWARCHGLGLTLPPEISPYTPRAADGEGRSRNRLGQGKAPRCQARPCGEAPATSLCCPLLSALSTQNRLVLQKCTCFLIFHPFFECFRSSCVLKGSPSLSLNAWQEP